MGGFIKTCPSCLAPIDHEVIGGKCKNCPQMLDPKSKTGTSRWAKTNEGLKGISDSLRGVAERVANLENVNQVPQKEFTDGLIELRKHCYELQKTIVNQNSMDRQVQAFIKLCENRMDKLDKLTLERERQLETRINRSLIDELMHVRARILRELEAKVEGEVQAREEAFYLKQAEAWRSEVRAAEKEQDAKIPFVLIERRPWWKFW